MAQDAETEAATHTETEAATHTHNVAQKTETEAVRYRNIGC